MSEALLKVDELKQHFPISRKFSVKAVNGVSFEIFPGETYGLVGESGSGKTTIGRSVIRLYDPTAGSITFEGKEISGRLDKDTRAMLRRDMQMIFQDPMSSLNPRKKVGDIIGEGLDIHKRYSSAAERTEAVGAMLKKVGLSPAHAERYPHQFSGGQRQRVGIARALAAEPEILLMDEPFGAVDEITRGRLQDELLALHQASGITVFFVTHDIGEALKLGTRTLVLEAGEIQQCAPPSRILDAPATPFVEALVCRSREFQIRA